MKTNIRWKLPPKIKYLEAVGAIADKRIILTKNGAQVKSSMGDRTYHVIFDYEKMIISSDDMQRTVLLKYLTCKAILHLIPLKGMM